MNPNQKQSLWISGISLAALVVLMVSSAFF